VTHHTASCPSGGRMSLRTKMLAAASVVALCFAGCNQAEPKQASEPARSPARATESGKQASKLASENEAAAQPGTVTLLRVPNGGIQPQALVDAKGTLHLIYFKGRDATAGDLFYVRREAKAERFSDPIRINSPPSRACATGSVRGGQIALGQGGRLHVVWNGVGTDYARLNDAGTAFEGQRNLMRQTEVPDGGCTVAADDAGNVYVVWHGQRKGERGEAKRQVWVARSTDEGKSFSLEEPAWAEPTGVCPCCSTRAFADRDGIVYVLYRSATAAVNRDTYVLVSEDRGKTFHQTLVHKWKVPG
jgi:hypothetical protein